MSAAIQTITVPAGGVIVHQTRAKIFVCVSCDVDTVAVRIDSGNKIEIRAGTNSGSPDSRIFSSLAFYNTGGAAATVKFYAGNEPFSNPLVSGAVILVRTDPATPFTVQVGNVAPLSVAVAGPDPLPVRQAESFSVAQADAATQTDRPDGWSQAYPGTVGGKRRRFMEIDNANAAGAATVYLGASRIARVLPMSARRLEVAEDLTVKNESGGDLALSIFEGFEP